MEQSRILAIEVAEAWRETLEELAQEQDGQDEAVRCALSLCCNLERRAETWPESRLHRALGFVQGVLVARGVTSYADQLALINGLKVAYPEDTDEELQEHLDPKSPFQLDLGGPG